MTRIAIDLSDLFAWYGSHDHVSGIQRVAQEIFSQKSEFDQRNIDYVARLNSGTEFYTIDKQLIFALGKHEKTEETVQHVRQLYNRHNKKNRIWMLLFEAIRRPRVILSKIVERLLKPAKVGRVIHESLNPEKLQVYNFTLGQTVVIVGAFWLHGNSAELFSELKHQHDLNIVTFIYDLIPVTHPEFCGSGVVQQYTRQIDPFAQLSQSFVVISNHVKAELQAYIKDRGFEQKPIFVMTFGFGLRRKLTSDPKWEAEALKALQLSGEDFAICVGSVEPRKNPGILLQAWRMLHRKYGNSIPLLIFVGGRGWNMDWFFDELVRCNYVDGKVRILHGIDDERLNLLYKKAKFALFPSFVEGWGLPVEEAIASGKYVLASNTSSLPEAGRDLAFHFDPHDEHSLVEELGKVILEKGYLKKRETKILKSLPQLKKKFTWKRSAIDLLAFLQNV